ncbi:cytochrome P450 [Gigaspora rosea]|uniref:Cytochrome P450 n=1 Tax=Gigaspora rosea TaxID=44941 RepID=A0A397VVA3_9GLOM|nr:cytochrome P450 [Gigaspora rosea]
MLILELFALILVLFILKFYYDYFTRSTPYPGPLPLPIIGNLHQYYYHSNDFLSWLRHLSSKYGDVFELYFGTCKHLMISDPKIVERIMSPVKDSNYFVRITAKDGLDELKKGKNGLLFNVDFNSWSYIRKFFKVIMAPNNLNLVTVTDVFHDLEKFWNSLIDDYGQFLNDEQEKSIEINFVPWSRKFFAETIMYLTASKKLDLLSNHYNKISKNLNNFQNSKNEEFFDRLILASDCVQYYIVVPPSIRNFPFIKFYTNYLYKNLTWTRNYACDLVRENRKIIESIDDKENLPFDILTMLLTANTPKDITNGISNDNNNEKPMTDEEVADNMMEILSEGIDSPANTLSFIVYYVGNNMEIEQFIIDEIKQVFGLSSNFKITYEDLSKLEYIEAVIKEALRIRPVTATISRFSENSDQIDEYKIPPSTQLAINVMGLHMNPNYWKNPNEFNPSRFLSNNNKSETFNKNAFMYFGGGLRMCPGKNLAMTQLKMLIVLLYSKYKFRIITKEPSLQNNVNTQLTELKIKINRRK